MPWDLELHNLTSHVVVQPLIYLGTKFEVLEDALKIFTTDEHVYGTVQLKGMLAFCRNSWLFTHNLTNIKVLKNKFTIDSPYLFRVRFVWIITAWLLSVSGRTIALYKKLVLLKSFWIHVTVSILLLFQDI